MNKSNLYVKLKLFLEYRRIVNKHSGELLSKYGIKLDWTNRMYTVLNIPESEFEEPYNIRKEDIDKISENFIKKYIGDLTFYLNSKGLNELFDFVKPISKVDKYSYLIVLGYSQIENTKLYKNFVFYTTLVSIFLYFAFHFIQNNWHLLTNH